MTNAEITSRLGELVRSERRITNEIIELIAVSDERRIYLERGFPSLMEWLVREFGYSHAAAFRRIQGARLRRAVPEVKKLLEEGKVNLTTVAQVQTAIRAQEKATGKRLSNETKATVIKKVEGQSIRETERTLLSIFPEIASTIHQEKLTVIDENTSRLTVNLANEAVSDLERVKEILSHSHPNATHAEIIALLLRQFVKKNDPLLKKNSEPKKTSEPSEQTQSAQTKATPAKSAPAARRVPVRSAVRKFVLQRANGGCEYRDPKTGRVCGSRFQIEIDHIVPRALGGGNDAGNLRCLCKKHNLLMAERMLGLDVANAWRLESSSSRVL